MKNAVLLNHKATILNLLWVALPIILLVAILPKLPESSTLQANYRYPFPPSLPGSDDRRGSLLREVTFYQQRVSQDPESGMNTAALAVAYMKMAKGTGESSWYLLAQQTAERSLTNLSFNNNSAVLVVARVAQAKHDFTEAIRLSQQVLKLERGNQQAQAILVTSHLALGKLSAAKAEADALANQSPNQGNLSLQALVQVAQGRDKDAINTFKLAIAAEEPGETGSSAWTRTMLGQYYYKHGQLALAGELYREALRILPRYPLALLHLAELETRQGDYKAAESNYDQVNPRTKETSTIFDHVVLRGKARLKHLQGEEKASVDLLDKAEILLRQQTTAGQTNGAFGHRRELARLLLERDRPQDAIEALSLMQSELAIRRDAQTLDTLAWALFRSGHIPEAKSTLDEALRLGTQDATIFYRAGTISEALSNHQQAETYFHLATDVDPTFDRQARQALGLGLDNFGF